MRVIKIKGEEFKDVKIGSDPELRFYGIKARSVVPHEGKFGTDGPDSQIGELRPDPFYCPIDHAFEIERVLSSGFRKFPALQKTKWLAGSMPEKKSLGGHIHFDMDYKVGLELKLKALDALLAPVVLMLEDEVTARERRCSTNYGRLATNISGIDTAHRGFKTKEHYAGSAHALSHGGIEYRPLSSWLVSKQIAFGVLSLAKVIAFQTNNESLHKHLWTQLKFVKMNKAFYTNYYECNKKYFMVMIPTIFRIIRTFKLYPQYSKYINYLFHLISQQRTWDENRDLKDRWNIMPIVKTSKIDGKLILASDNSWDNILNDSIKVEKHKLYFGE